MPERKIHSPRTSLKCRHSRAKAATANPAATAIATPPNRRARREIGNRTNGCNRATRPHSRTCATTSNAMTATPARDRLSTTAAPIRTAANNTRTSGLEGRPSWTAWNRKRAAKANTTGKSMFENTAKWFSFTNSPVRSYTGKSCGSNRWTSTASAMATPAANAAHCIPRTWRAESRKATAYPAPIAIAQPSASRLPAGNADPGHPETCSAGRSPTPSLQRWVGFQAYNAINAAMAPPANPCLHESEPRTRQTASASPPAPGSTQAAAGAVENGRHAAAAGNSNRNSQANECALDFIRRAAATAATVGSCHRHSRHTGDNNNSWPSI